MDTSAPSNSLNIGLPQIDYLPFLNGVAAHYPQFVAGVRETVGVLAGISIPLSLFFVIGIIYCVEQLKHIRKKEEAIYDLKVEPGYETVDAGDPALSHRWESVTAHIESPNQNDWKQAIIEADIILDDILNKMGYRGESVGEKLKRVEPGDFKSLNEAWEAHKVRNQIAHEPGFVINQHEAKQVVNMYRKVFEEFFYI